MSKKHFSQYARVYSATVKETGEKVAVAKMDQGESLYYLAVEKKEIDGEFVSLRKEYKPEELTIEPLPGAPE